jgi:flavin reductase (DIM6/NTAB) family NADH-FMN oxidoreductase RutF
LNESVFRQVMGHLPTGVTIVAGYDADGAIGMAANSVTSVSLDPPLVLFCPAKSSRTWPLIRASGMFCVNVMAGHHEAATRRFSLRGIDRFEGIDYTEKPCGPALTDAVAWIECTIQDEHEAGDHTIVVAQVQRLETSSSEARPLVFFRGAYGTFTEA